MTLVSAEEAASLTGIPVEWLRGAQEEIVRMLNDRHLLARVDAMYHSGLLGSEDRFDWYVDADMPKMK